MDRVGATPREHRAPAARRHREHGAAPAAQAAASEPVATGPYANPVAAVARTTLATREALPQGPGSDSLRAAIVQDMQRRYGNQAVQNFLRQGDARRSAVQRDGPPAGAPGGGSPAPGAPAADQGAIGDVVLSLGNRTLFDHDSYEKKWVHDLANVELYGAGQLEVPQLTDKKLKAELGLFANANVHANFYAGYGPGELRNLKVGMSRKQALLLGAAMATGGVGLAALATYLGKFTATAQLSVPTKVTLGFGVTGQLRAGASLVREIAYLETGVSADATAEVAMPIERDVSLYWDGGKLHVERKWEIDPTLDLEFQLNAFIKAELLETWSWEKHWNLTKTLIDKWPLRAILELHGDADEAPQLSAANMAMLRPRKGVKFTIEEDKMDDSALVKKVFRGSKGDPDKVEKKGAGRGSAGGAGRHRAPVGTEDDPILMIWAKPLGRYRNPVWLDTPNQQGREPFYRDRPKALPSGKTIGVSGPYWGEVGRVLRKGEKTTRGGQEDAFVKDLEEYGFEGFSDGEYSPDHVLDLDWGGPDSYANLWPLTRSTNVAAGRYHSFDQTVEFNLPDDPPEREPRNEKLSYVFFRGRYFKIKQVADPP